MPETDQRIFDSLGFFHFGLHVYNVHLICATKRTKSKFSHLYKCVVLSLNGTTSVSDRQVRLWQDPPLSLPTADQPPFTHSRFLPMRKLYKFPQHIQASFVSCSTIHR